MPGVVPGNPKSFGESGRTVNVLGKVENRFQAADENTGGLLWGFYDDVEKMMKAVNKIHVKNTRGPPHYFISGGGTVAGMRGKVGCSAIGFGFSNLTYTKDTVFEDNQVAAQEFLGDQDYIFVKERLVQAVLEKSIKLKIRYSGRL
jgi:hypothetical protein